MKRIVWWVIVVFGVGVFSLIFYHAWQKTQPAPQPSARVPAAPPAPSAGQKVLMRMGNENAARLKAKLREIRSELTRHEPAG
jgi:hypothetical protein